MCCCDTDSSLRHLGFRRSAGTTVTPSRNTAPTCFKVSTLSRASELVRMTSRLSLLLLVWPAIFLTTRGRIRAMSFGVQMCRLPTTQIHQSGQRVRHEPDARLIRDLNSVTRFWGAKWYPMPAAADPPCCPVDRRRTSACGADDENAISRRLSVDFD